MGIGSKGLLDDCSWCWAVRCGLMRDDEWMGRALAQARMARDMAEVPVGAIIVMGGQVIGTGHNRTITDVDPSAHAEIVALRAAARTVGVPRLPEAELYVTLEPCAMCVGALIQSRIRRLVFGCRDPKAGAVTSLFSLASDKRLNHRIPFEEDVRCEESRALLQGFFRARRRVDLDQPDG